MRKRQALLPDYRPCLCKYCGGRGFHLAESAPERDKEVKYNVVLECKFCGGSGLCHL